MISKKHLQYSLRFFLLPLLAFLLFLVLVANLSWRQHAGVSKVMELGGRVSYEATGAKWGGSRWPALFWRVQVVNLGNMLMFKPRGKNITDEKVIEILDALPDLPELYLDGTNVTDAVLKRLEDCSQLIRVRLVGTAVSEKGIQRLRTSLPNCQVIDEFLLKVKSEESPGAGLPGNYYQDLIME